MPITVPDSISFPDTEYVGGFVPSMALMASSIQSALSTRQGKTFVWPTQTQRDAQTGMQNGDTGFQQDTSRRFVYNGSSWVSFESRPHVEYTATSASVATSTNASIGTLTYDAARSNVPSIGAISLNTVTLTEAGIYGIDMVGAIPANPTGNYFMQVSDGTNIYKVNGTTSSGALGGCAVSNLFAVTSGVILTFQFFHISAANRVLTSRISVSKIGS